MSKIEKTKKIVLIAFGFVLSAYLMISGINILNSEEDNVTKSE